MVRTNENHAGTGTPPLNDTGVPTSEVRYTEFEWLNKWRMEVPDDVFMVANHTLVLEAHMISDVSPPLPVIGCGATGTAVGECWLRAHIPSSRQRHRRKTQKSLRFGDSRIPESTESVEVCLTTPVQLRGNMRVRRFWLKADIIPTLKIPLLISRPALRRMGGSIDFTSNVLSMHDGDIRLLPSKNGHMRWHCADFIPPMMKGGLEKAYLMENSILAVAQQPISSDALRRLHLHLRHGSIACMTRLLDASKCAYDNKELEQVVSRCTCVDSNRKIRKPLVTSYFPPHVGRTISMDVFPQLIRLIAVPPPRKMHRFF